MGYQLPIARQTPLIAGIDPDIDKSGLAIWSRKDRKYTVLKVLPFAELQETLCSYDPAELSVVVEAAWLNGDIMYRHHEKNLPKDFNKWTIEGRYAYMFKRGTDVGRNFAVGQTLVHYLKANGYDVEERKPESKKWDSATFQSLTKLKIRTNQEVRDAAKLVFQRDQSLHLKLYYKYM